MNNNMIIYASIMLIGVFISSLAQILLKQEADKEHKSIICEYFNPRVIIAYIIFFVAMFLSIYAYKVVPLSFGAILEATGYIYVTIFGVVIFKEKLNIKKILALCLILVGIAIYSLLG